MCCTQTGASVILVFRHPVDRVISDHEHEKRQRVNATMLRPLEEIVLDGEGNADTQSPLLRPSTLMKDACSLLCFPIFPYISPIIIFFLFCRLLRRLPSCLD